MLTGNESAFASSPAWSADGSALVYTLSPRNEQSIWLIDANGNGLQRLTDGINEDIFPVWGAPEQAAVVIQPTAVPPSCPGAATPRMFVGAEGVVTPGLRNNVRERPDRQARNLFDIPPGGLFEVLDGPVCEDGLFWWQVDYYGSIGWTAEGYPGDYWLEPVGGVRANPTLAPVVTAADCSVEALRRDTNTRTLPNASAIRGGPINPGEILQVTGKSPLSTEFPHLLWWRLETGVWVREDLVREIGNCTGVPLVSS